ncbi:hypothetical protein FF1_000848 [Malus domestica]
MVDSGNGEVLADGGFKQGVIWKWKGFPLKKSLFLAFKDVGGFEALVTGKTTDMDQIDMNERITTLERVNPTPRPTTYPGRLFWKDDEISSGLDLEAQVFLLPDFCLRGFLQLWLV